MCSSSTSELGAGGGSGTIVFRADQGVDDPAVTAAMEELFATVNAGFPDQDGNPQHPGPPSSRPTPSKAARRSSARPLAGQLAYAQVNLAADVGLTESAALGEAIADEAPVVDAASRCTPAAMPWPCSNRRRPNSSAWPSPSSC